MDKFFDYDLIVCGGGLSGFAAAVCASRLGVKTLIIERYGFLGGAATNSLSNPFMKYMEDEEWVNKGVFGEIIRRLDLKGGLFSGNQATFNEEILKIILDEMTEEAGVDVLFHSFIPEVKVEGDRITSVITASKAGLTEFKAKCFIDGTGDADIAAFSGCKTETGDADGFCQPMTLNFRISDVDRNKYAPVCPGPKAELYGVDSKEVTKTVNALYRKFREDGKINNPRENLLTFPCMSENMIHFNATRVVMHDATDPFSLSDAERIARRQMVEIFYFLKENIPGFEKSNIAMSAPQIGVRESRRLVGMYVLTADDLLSCVKFDDSIARGVYNIDIHNPKGSGTVLKSIPKGDYYTIPLRSLMPGEISNLIVCGRPISATFEAHSAIRIMPIATCIGHAAGAAAYLGITNKKDARDVSYSDVQDILLKQGGLF